MSRKCKCPRCGTPPVVKGDRKSEVEAKAKLLFTMQTERTYVCPKCRLPTPKPHNNHEID